MQRLGVKRCSFAYYACGLLSATSRRQGIGNLSPADSSGLSFVNHLPLPYFPALFGTACWKEWKQGFPTPSQWAPGGEAVTSGWRVKVR